jgi:glycine cleavage system H lipoate-binding protein|tara:strand:- start:1692 stop:2264 length:573 start_codon:yes stop_codon:yes gene_type:complete
MGKFPISDGIVGKAMRATGKTGTPNALPAWVFENQTGVLGTYLNSSVVWCGVAGSLNVIPAGTSLASAKTISLTSGGTNYTAGTRTTTCSNNMAQGLTLVITVAGGVIQTLTIASAGSGYNVGDIITVVEAGRAAGSVDAKAEITAVNNGVPVAAQAIEFKVQAGGILPVAVDYITSLSTITEADIVICK